MKGKKGTGLVGCNPASEGGAFGFCRGRAGAMKQNKKRDALKRASLFLEKLMGF